MPGEPLPIPSQLRRGSWTVSLRVMLGALVILPCLLAWTLNEFRRYTHELTALKVLHPKLIGADTPVVHTTFANVGGWLGYPYAGHSTREITLGQCTVEDRDLEQILQLQNLESINFHQGPYTPQAFTRLLALPKLKSIRLAYCKPFSSPLVGFWDGPPSDDNEFQEWTISYWPPAIAIPGLNSGRTVQPFPDPRLSGYVLTDAHFAAFAQATQLKHLTIAYFPTDAAFLTRLPRHARLESLNLNGTELNDDVIRATPRLETLISLSVWDTRVTGVGLSRFPHLQVLDLGQNQISHAAICELSQLPALRELNLVGTPVDGDWIAPLAAIRSLRKLHVFEGEFRTGELATLARLRPDLEVSFSRYPDLRTNDLAQVVPLQYTPGQPATYVIPQLMIQEWPPDPSQPRYLPAVDSNSPNVTPVYSNPSTSSYSYPSTPFQTNPSTD